MYRFKYLHNFNNFIIEQAIGADAPADAGMAPTSAPKDSTFLFIFIDEGNTGDYKYPDGSSSKSYQTYEIDKTDLEDWLRSNVVGKGITGSEGDVKQKAILDFISGEKGNISPEAKEYMSKFKNNVLANVIGKKAGETEVIFSPKDNEPTTDDFDVTFIILPKGK